MGFVIEFAREWIKRSMEDPEERDRKFREHVATVKAAAEKMKAVWGLPVKAMASWNSDKNNAKYLLDLKLSRLPGRMDPYEEVLLLNDRFQFRWPSPPH